MTQLRPAARTHRLVDRSDHVACFDCGGTITDVGQLFKECPGPVRQSMSVEELRAAVDDAAMARGAAAMYPPSVWFVMSEEAKLAAQSPVWSALKAVFCDA